MEANNVNQLSSINSTHPNDALQLEDFWQYRLSIQIHLYYFPFIISVGIPGNVISFVVLVFSSFRRSTTARYLAVISILDVIILCTGAVWLINKRMPEEDVFRPGSCKAFLFVFYFTAHWDVLLLVAVTAERYIVVVFPLMADTMVSMKRTVVIICLAALLSVGLNMHHFFTAYVRVSNTTGLTYCGSSGGETTKFFKYRIYPWIDSIIYFVLPFTAIFVLNISMMHITGRATRRRGHMQNMRSSDVNRKQIELTVMLLLVSFFFLLLTGPMGVILIVERIAWIPTSLKEKAVHRLIHSVVDNMMYTNHAINFLFYCFSGQRFRNEVRRLMCSFRKDTVNSISRSSANSPDLNTIASTL
ncbi:probable G-protein coupled receptor B0563.6 [Gigantopelta aegis]|uniref:probable G-protein coupled receptor B0563.6 n=1 Tax=Gigantopelta aegis TaxID=1735272 RepID=UPI001B88E073|nr:probable G-protein coupled receptor B0563.6 [Gigantopelta aegis]